jgi:methionyl-tRNA synthetase
LSTEVGIIPEPADYDELDKSVIDMASKSVREYCDSMDRLAYNNALDHLWELVRETNRYIDHSAPWKLAKNGEDKKVGTAVHTFVESLRQISVMLYPFMPASAEKIWKQLGIENEPALKDFASLYKWGAIKAGAEVAKGEILFPRIDVKKDKKAEDEKPAKTAKGEGEKKEVDQGIDIKDFMNVELKAALIREAERVPKSDKLIKLQVDLGDESRQVVAGIGKAFEPDELIGKKVVVVSNLKPAKLMGVESQGMVLAAADGDGLRLISVDGDVKPGTRIK